jgi:hypothetical protein
VSPAKALDLGNHSVGIEAYMGAVVDAALNEHLVGLPVEVRGLTRDQPTPPPKPDLTIRAVLHLLPTSVLAQINAAFEQVRAQQQAIPVEAKPV